MKAGAGEGLRMVCALSAAPSLAGDYVTEQALGNMWGS